MIKFKQTAVILLFSTAPTFAESTSWQPTQQLISNVPQQLLDFAKINDCHMILPKKLPVTSEQKQYYLHTEKNALGCTAYIDYTAACQGAHYCNAGFITVADNKLPSGQPLKTSTGVYYFQKGHAEADYQGKQISWLEGKTLYQLSWPQATSVELIKMAESIHAQKP